MASGNSSLFSPGSWTEGSRIAHVLRKETVGGALLLGAAVIALVWANSPWSSSYFSMLDLVAGPELLHLNLSLETWAADGLWPSSSSSPVWNSNASSSPATCATADVRQCRSSPRSAA